MTASRWRWSLGTLLIAVPLLNLALQALGWLRYGIDLPYYDDFRGYELGTAQSLAFKDLFRPQNDTFYPVGMALDALMYRYLNGNVVAYQFLTMVALLGGLLWLQWRLLSAALSDRLLAAAAFALCAFMAQPGTYWGIQYMAYHQGLPLLFLMIAISLIVLGPWRAWSAAAVFVLGLLAGLSYISGAACGLTVAVTLLALSAMHKPFGFAQRFRKGGLALLAAALITLPAQAWVILGHQKGLHIPGQTWAPPTDLDFWVFLFGRVARALTLPRTQEHLSFLIAVLLAALVAALALLLLKRFIRDSAETRLTPIFLVFLVAVATQVAMVAAARANFRAAGMDDFEGVFLTGYGSYYHFFWVTALLPWAFAAAIAYFRPRAAAIAPAAAALIIAAGAFGGIFAQNSYFRDLSKQRVAHQLPCLHEKLAHAGDMMCPSLYPNDLGISYAHALTIGATFTRLFPLQPIPLGDTAPPLFRLSDSTPAALRLFNLAPPVVTPEGWQFEPTNADPIILVPLPADALKTCLVTDVTLRLRLAQKDRAALFVLWPGAADFAEPPAAHIEVVPTNGVAEIVLRSLSPNGLGDLLRIDPVATTQPFTIEALEVRCRLPVHKLPHGDPGNPFK